MSSMEAANSTISFSPTPLPSTNRKAPNIRRWCCRSLTQHYPMLQRNLFYTGLTRGKRLVIIVGQRKAAAIAVRNASGRRRWTKLKDWLSA